MAHLRRPGSNRDVFVALAMLALAFKLLWPPGFMPGTSFAQPIVICNGHGPERVTATPMRGMAHHGEHRHSQMPHGVDDHPCPFGTVDTAPIVATFGLPGAIPALPAIARPFLRTGLGAPGRGMAAPPPPSHGPPTLQA